MTVSNYRLTLSLNGSALIGGCFKRFLLRVLLGRVWNCSHFPHPFRAIFGGFHLENIFFVVVVECPFCRSAYLCTSINRTWIQVNEPSILGWIIIRDDAREKSILWVPFHRFCRALPEHVCVLTQSTRLSSLLNSNIMFSSVQREVVFQNVSSWRYYCLPDYRSSSSRLSFTTLILWSVKENTSKNILWLPTLRMFFWTLRSIMSDVYSDWCEF